jgi:hypothetical protein
MLQAAGMPPYPGMTLFIEKLVSTPYRDELKMKEKNLFIAMTPYHLFLSIAMRTMNSNDTVLLIDEHGELSHYRSVIPKLISNFVYLQLENTGIMSSIINFNRLISSRKKKEVEETTNKLSLINNVYVFNDNNFTVQYFLSKIHKNHVFYIEDGAAPYNDHIIHNSYLKKLIYRLCFGSFYEFSSVLGTCSFIEKSFFLHPELVRKENKTLPHSIYEFSPDAKILLKRLFLLHPKTGKLKAEKIRKHISLFLLPRIDMLKEDSDILTLIRSKILEETSTGKQVFIKAHPLDQGVTKVPEIKNLTQIPKSLPAEALPTFFKNITSLYSPPNTSLLSFRRLFPSIKTYCITNKNEEASTLCINLKKIGVELLY